MNKGIVMEMSDRHVIVMTPRGDFRQLPRDGRTCEIGEEILFAEPTIRRKVPPMAKLSGLVAAVVLCIVVFAGVTDFTGKNDVVAYVSMDINPSVEIGIDNAEKVWDLRGLNDDGKQLIAGLNYKGLDMAAVAEAILQKAEQGPLAKGEGDIIIASSIVKDTKKIDDAAIADKLKEQVAKHLREEHPTDLANYEVTAFAAPVEIRQEAASQGLSTGKYAIYLAAKSNGNSVPLEDFKKESIHQIAQANGGIDELVNPQSMPAKATFKQLLEDEKSGKLTERAKQAADQKVKPTSAGSSKNADDKNAKNDSKSSDKKDNGKTGGSKNDNGKNNDNSKNDTSKNNNGKNDNNKNNKSNDDSKPANKPSTTKPAGGDRSAEQDPYIKKDGKTNSGSKPTTSDKPDSDKNADTGKKDSSTKKSDANKKDESINNDRSDSDSGAKKDENR